MQPPARGCYAPGGQAALFKNATLIAPSQFLRLRRQDRGGERVRVIVFSKQRDADAIKSCPFS